MDTMPELFNALPRLFARGDFIAAAVFLGCWFLTSAIIERRSKSWPSVSHLMERHREAWMVEVGRREARIMDAHLLGTLRQGAAFFASTCLIAIGGVAALIGQAEELVSVGRDLGAGLGQGAEAVWEAKLLVVLLLLVNGFLKFVWAHRLFGYVVVLIGAMPERSEPGVDAAVARADAINQAASRNFNRGLRTVYFAIAALAWFLGAVPWMAATALTVAMLFRREFASRSRRALLER